MRVVAKMVNQITPANVQHRAGGNDGAESHFLPVAPVEDRCQKRSTLAQKRDAARLRRLFSESGIQPNCRVHDAQTVGANQTYGAAAQLLLNLLLQGSSLRTMFPESGRYHDRRPDVGIHTLFDDLRDRRRRSGNYGQINGARNVADTPVGFDSQHFRMLRVNGVDFSSKALVPQILQNGPAYGARTTGRTDERHGGWREHCIQAVSRGWFFFIRRSSHQTSLGRTHSSPSSLDLA